MQSHQPRLCLHFAVEFPLFLHVLFLTINPGTTSECARNSTALDVSGVCWVPGNVRGGTAWPLDRSPVLIRCCSSGTELLGLMTFFWYRYLQSLCLHFVKQHCYRYVLHPPFPNYFRPRPLRRWKCACETSKDSRPSI